MPELSLWERLGKAAMLDIESNDFSWSSLSSLYHTKHTSSTEPSEDELNKALEVCFVEFVSSFTRLILLSVLNFMSMTYIVLLLT